MPPSHPHFPLGLSELAPSYDALICDVWGVLHNGAVVFPAACAALTRFREQRGPVILLSNAPRPAGDLLAQFAQLGVPPGCYDAIVTSGEAVRQELAARSATKRLGMFHLGPARDANIYLGLDVHCVDAAQAEIVLCSGLFDDETETPGDYTARLAEMKALDLTMLCANPDLQVQRGGKLVWCAGALAAAYEAIGGAVVYFGKPHRPIYDLALARTGGARRPLCIGDGLHTDIKGANGAGLDALFIADGVHGEHIEPFTPAHMAELFAAAGVSAHAAMRALVW